MRRRIMLLRKLLACLALLTGLTAAGAPAQARLIGALSAQVEASQSLGEIDQAQKHIDVAAAAPAKLSGSTGFIQIPKRLSLHSVPVLTGIDRARE